jgi:parallel beta-helix repeat protein
LDENNIPTDGAYTLFLNITEKVISDHNFTGEVEFMECSSISLINISFRQTDRGLKLTQCNGFEIVSMEARGLLHEEGIFLDNCNDIYIEGSLITDCNRGIGINRTSNAIISNSNISGNRGEGIRITNVSNNCRIEDCEIGYNRGNGIEISSSNSISIIGNDIEMNKEYGVRISYSIGCNIHTNHFVKNNGILGQREGGRSQAYSMHQDNKFYIQDPDTKQGNFWSDWNDPGLDEDGDWIIDTPYEIESEEGASDQYPSLYRFDYVEEDEPYRINGDDWVIIIIALIPAVLVIFMLGFAIVITFGRRK